MFSTCIRERKRGKNESVLISSRALDIFGSSRSIFKQNIGIVEDYSCKSVSISQHRKIIRCLNESGLSGRNFPKRNNKSVT